MKDNKWYRQEIAKLQALLCDKNEDAKIHKCYVSVRLDRMLRERELPIFKTLEPIAEKIEEQTRC